MARFGAAFAFPGGEAGGTPAGGGGGGDRPTRQQARHYQLLSELQELVKELPSSSQQRLSYTILSDLALALLDGTVFEIVQGLLDIQHLTERNLYNQRLKLQMEHRALKQEVLRKHKEDQQSCQPHNLPLLKAAQQREMEVKAAAAKAGPVFGGKERIPLGRQPRARVGNTAAPSLLCHVQRERDSECLNFDHVTAVEQRIHTEQRMMDEKIVLELDQKVVDQQSTLEKAGVSGFYITTSPQELTLQMNLLELIRKLQQKELPPRPGFS